MKIAFLIQAYEDEEHLKKLVNTLNGHDVFIDWDAKSGKLPDIENVIFTNRRISVFWAGFTQIEATMELIKSVLASGKDYQKIVLLSGSCYPIKPINCLERLFENDNNKNYLKAIKVNDADFLKKQVSKKKWRDHIFPVNIKRTSQVKRYERLLRFGINMFLGILPKKKIDMEIYHGSQWWALNQNTVRYVLNIYENRPDIVNFFKFTFASDEKFFHTIVRNSEHIAQCDPYAEYTGRGTYKMANLHIIDPSLTKWFSLADFDEIMNSDKFFVRKLRTSSSKALVEKINNVFLES